MSVTDHELPSNWGRWGETDQLGTLNLIDDAARARAVAEVRTGQHVSLARRIVPVSLSTGRGPVGSPAMMPAAVLQTVNFTGTDPMAMTDTLIVNVHHAGSTHLDALAHMPVDGQIYPGVPVGEAVTPSGVQHGSADPFGTGILTRGVLLDPAPGDHLEEDRRIGADDLERAVAATGLTVEVGDAVVVRGGWDPNVPLSQPIPGVDLSAVQWLHQHGVSVYLGDVGDARPLTIPLPLHQVALARLGIPLVDATAVDDLSSVCSSQQRYSFMLVLAPPAVTGTTGLPVNPIAIF